MAQVTCGPRTTLATSSSNSPAPTAAVISPPQATGSTRLSSEPYGLAIDASGNLWLSNSDTNTLTQFVGLASPIKTPLLGPPVQP